MGWEIRGIRESVPRPRQGISAADGRWITQRLGHRHPDLSSRPERHGDPRRVGQSIERDRSETSLVDRRIGGFGSVHPHRAHRDGRFRKSARRVRELARLDRRRLELCWTQPTLWCSRARDGINRERVGGAWRHHSVHCDVPHFLGLHAATDSAGGTHGTRSDLRFHPRQHCSWRRWLNPSADRAIGLDARDPKPARHPSLRCE